MSYDSVVRKVAEMAWEYPFFTWDEAGTYQKLAEAKVRECHCRPAGGGLCALPFA
ncbi:unnamed protein product [Effrenium voratum]|uniref:Uncharacterized protein n=1 Tax=Effrenium voratum TaxID=2562239 RepID=A0AA36MRK9_9DINO|nr:unnamed protein product [Effrenium voratum]